MTTKTPCQTANQPDLFFPTSPTQLRVARKLCSGCPVLDACKAYAVEHKEVGVWGGKLFPDRRQTVAGNSTLITSQ